MPNETNPGIHTHLDMDIFSLDEQRIVKRIAQEWYVTTSGTISLGKTSEYSFILIKPLNIFQEMFDIEREIVVIFSQYENFEPRTLDAITAVASRFQPLRLERICSVLVSKDVEIETKIINLLKNDQESQIVVPFNYTELLTSNSDSFFFRNRFKKHFYGRDLFASEAPLKRDLYFFGRTDLVQRLANRHRSNQISGLFGLRKTGKTSVIFGIQRSLDKIDAKSVFIDCQNPSFHRNRWNQALYYVVNEIKLQLKLDTRIRPELDFTEEKAAVYFESALLKFWQHINRNSILLIFDEIENITHKVSPSSHWCDGLDFVYFWQTLRSVFQKHNNVFTYLLVGTNPLCVEQESIQGKDNPIFGQIPIEYIPRFDVPQTREMVRRLGRIMGLQFDEIIYGKLTDDFGGHPYLIRHMCSVINKHSQASRPLKIDKTLYESSKKIFLREYTHFLEMILNVLKDYFPDEYEMLCFLSRGDIDSFNEFAYASPLYTNHLIGYGILEESKNGYSFRIEVINHYLKEKNKYKKLNQSTEEMIAEISARRNGVERKLRKIISIVLYSRFSPNDAKNEVLNLFGDPRKTKYATSGLNELFDANKTEIYFSDLTKIINKHWEGFKNIFGNNKNEVISFLDNINKYRADAHAKSLTADEMTLFRISCERIEDKLNQVI